MSASARGAVTSVEPTSVMERAMKAVAAFCKGFMLSFLGT